MIKHLNKKKKSGGVSLYTHAINIHNNLNRVIFFYKDSEHFQVLEVLIKKNLNNHNENH